MRLDLSDRRLARLQTRRGLTLPGPLGVADLFLSEELAGRGKLLEGHAVRRLEAAEVAGDDGFRGRWIGVGV